MRISIVDILIERDGLTLEEAQGEVKEARQEIMELLAEDEYPFDYCERWGLEPDYLEDLI